MHAPDKNDITYIEERYGKIIGWVPGAVDQKTGKINPQVTQAYLGGNTFASVFHVKPVYYETYAGEWRPLSEVTTWHGNHRIEFNKDWWKVHPRYMAWLEKRMKLINGKLLIPSLFQDVVSPYSGIIRELHQSLVPLNIGLTTSTFYPDPNTETTTVDGGVATLDSLNGWANVQPDTTGQYPNDDAIHIQDGGHGVIGIQTYSSAGDYNVIRAFILFNTASISDGDTIDSATLSLYFNLSQATLDNDANAYVSIVSSNPASNTALASGDIDNVGSTQFATGIALTSISTSAYTDFALNSSGISNISKTGLSKFSAREGHDIVNDTPTFVANSFNRFRTYSADQTGTANDPKLVVVHSASASTFIPRISFIM